MIRLKSSGSLHFTKESNGGKKTASPTWKPSLDSPRGEHLWFRGTIAQFYRTHFAGRERNHLVWQALHYVLSAYDTLLIVATDGKCLRQEELVLRESLTYDDLFSESARFFESVVGPLQREVKSEFRLLGKIYNEEFSSGDAEFYHSMIRHLRPNRVIEIGAGHSTWFAARALRLNVRGSLLAIDPAPRRALPRAVSHIRSKVEDVQLEVFDKLGEGDVLFIDSSHTAEEATYHVKTILPRLRSGVVIHHHDVSYPYRPIFPEEDVILDFYARSPAAYRVLCGLAYVRCRHDELLKRRVPSFAWHDQRAPGSLWVQKVAPSHLVERQDNGHE